jgi:hypothetical protein
MTCAGILLLVLSSFQRDQVITGNLAFLVGEYDFLCTFQENATRRVGAEELTDKYTVKITKKDEMIVYKNGKKLDKYTFNDARVPVLEEENYVMFNKKDQFYPLFYKGDTIVFHITPFQYDDNYFVKSHK